MNYAEWIFGMMLRLGSAAFLPQEEPLQERPDATPQPLPRAPLSLPPSELRMTWSSANPEHLNRLDLASWHHAGGELVQAVVGYDSNDAVWLKLLRIGGAGAAQYALDFTAHEFGHVSSFTRAGCRDIALGSETQTADEWTSPTLEHFLMGAFGGDPAPITVSASDWGTIQTIFAGKPREYAEFMILTKAGGLNQEQIGLAEHGERMGEEGFSLLDVVPYVLGATSTLRYNSSLESGDLDDYLERLEELGVSSNATSIRLLSAARLLSGSGLSLMGAFLSDLAGGRPELAVATFSLGEDANVALPEFESYLSRFGPTLKLSIPARLWGVDLRPSYERSFAGGESTHEAGLRASGVVLDGFLVRAAAFLGDEGGRWLEAGVEARPFSWLTINAGYVSAAGYTVHREVYGANLPMIERRESGLQISVGLTYAF